jgi:hypothetical protein
MPIRAKLLLRACTFSLYVIRVVVCRARIQVMEGRGVPNNLGKERSSAIGEFGPVGLLKLILVDDASNYENFLTQDVQRIATPSRSREEWHTWKEEHSHFNFRYISTIENWRAWLQPNKWENLIAGDCYIGLYVSVRTESACTINIQRRTLSEILQDELNGCRELFPVQGAHMHTRCFGKPNPGSLGISRGFLLDTTLLLERSNLSLTGAIQTDCCDCVDDEHNKTNQGKYDSAFTMELRPSPSGSALNAPFSYAFAAWVFPIIKLIAGILLCWFGLCGLFLMLV